MNNVKLINWAVFIFCLAMMSCKGLVHAAQDIAKYEERRQYDLRFSEDILNGANNFHFDPLSLPQIGKTTEHELNQKYPSGPSFKLTFLKPIEKDMLGKKFKMDRLYLYNRTVQEPFSDEAKFGYVAKERMTLVAFISQGIVAQYLVTHELLGSDGIWREGEYTRKIPNFKGKRFESWPNENFDNDCYFVQRTDRALILGNDAAKELNCPYWEAVPIDESLQRQTPLVKALIYILSFFSIITSSSASSL